MWYRICHDRIELLCVTEGNPRDRVCSLFRQKLGSVTVWVRTDTLNNKALALCACQRWPSYWTRTTASFQVHFIDMLSKPGLPGGNNPWYLVPLEQKVRLVHRIRQQFVCSTKNILHHSAVGSRQTGFPVRCIRGNEMSLVLSLHQRLCISFVKIAHAREMHSCIARE
jgi:hypothetical protein